MLDSSDSEAGAACPMFSFDMLRQQPDEVAVYMCGQCRLPLGDSKDLKGCHQGDRIVLLNAVTENVKKDKNKTASMLANEVDSTFQLLHCNGCSSTIGKFYCTTPQHLSYKQNLFSLDMNAINSHSLYTCNKQIIPKDEAPMTLHDYNIVEEEIKKSTILLALLMRTISDLENKLGITEESP